MKVKLPNARRHILKAIQHDESFPPEKRNRYQDGYLAALKAMYAECFIADVAKQKVFMYGQDRAIELFGSDFIKGRRKPSGKRKALRKQQRATHVRITGRAKREPAAR